MKVLFTLIFCFYSLGYCQNSPSRWSTTDKPDEFDPEVLSILDFTINDIPLIISKKDLISKYGKPDTIIIRSGVFHPKKHIEDKSASKNTLVEYQKYIYGPISFAVWNNYAQTVFINFQDSDIILNHPLITLSKNTHINEIKSKFPYSYDWRNYLLHRQFGLDPKDETGLELENFTWIDFKNGLDEYYWNIELTFLNDYLIWVYFEIVEDDARP